MGTSKYLVERCQSRSPSEPRNQISQKLLKKAVRGVVAPGGGVWGKQEEGGGGGN